MHKNHRVVLQGIELPKDGVDGIQTGFYYSFHSIQKVVLYIFIQQTGKQQEDTNKRIVPYMAARKQQPHTRMRG